MILIGLGANLPTARYGAPEKGLEAALDQLDRTGVSIADRSRWYRSPPIPASDQPWYVNGVVAVKTALSARTLMARLLEIETAFGRTRDQPLAPRVLDLDLLDYDGLAVKIEADAEGPALVLPHPRLTERAFVLVPLAEIAPDWRHPTDGRDVAGLISALEGQQIIQPLARSRACNSRQTAY